MNFNEALDLVPQFEDTLVPLYDCSCGDRIVTDEALVPHMKQGHTAEILRSVNSRRKLSREERRAKARELMSE